jgi:hypothetical protein
MDYKILLGDAATPHDLDMLIMVARKNMAAFDDARQKFPPAGTCLAVQQARTHRRRFPHLL